MWSNIIVAVVSGSLLINFCSGLFAIVQIVSFLRRCQRLDSVDNLRDYHLVVSRCMYCALLMTSSGLVIGLFIGLWLSDFAANFTTLTGGQLNLSKLNWLFALTLGEVSFVTLISFLAERRMKAIPTSTTDMKIACDGIKSVWKWHVFPKPFSEHEPFELQET